MREFEIILFQTQSLSIKPKGSLVLIKNTLKRFAKHLWLNFTLYKLKLILRITYLTYI
jgi:hypothetical protein